MQGLETTEFLTQMVLEVWEIQPCEFASELISGLVVSHGGFLGCVEGSEPEPCSVFRESNFSNPLAPMPLPYSSVEFGGLRGRLHQGGLRAKKARE